MKFDYLSSYDARVFGELEERDLLPADVESEDNFHSFIRPRIEKIIEVIRGRADNETNPFLLPSIETLKEIHRSIFSGMLSTPGTFNRPLAEAALKTLAAGTGRLSSELESSHDMDFTKAEAFGEYFISLVRDQPFGAGSDHVALSVLAAQLQHCFSEEMAANFFGKRLEFAIIESHYENTSAILTRSIINVQQRVVAIQKMNEMALTNEL